MTDETAIDSTIQNARSQQRSVGEVDDELEHIHHHHQNLLMTCDATRTSQEECGVQQVIRLFDYCCRVSMAPPRDSRLQSQTGDFTLRASHASII